MTRQQTVLSLWGVIVATVVVAIVRFNATALWLDYVLILALIGTVALLVLIALP
jgi:hypothetical protein